MPGSAPTGSPCDGAAGDGAISSGQVDDLAVDAEHRHAHLRGDVGAVREADRHGRHVGPKRHGVHRRELGTGRDLGRHPVRGVDQRGDVVLVGALRRPSTRPDAPSRRLRRPSRSRRAGWSCSTRCGRRSGGPGPRPRCAVSCGGRPRGRTGTSRSAARSFDGVRPARHVRRRRVEPGQGGVGLDETAGRGLGGGQTPGRRGTSVSWSPRWVRGRGRVPSARYTWSERAHEHLAGVERAGVRADHATCRPGHDGVLSKGASSIGVHNPATTARPAAACTASSAAGTGWLTVAGLCPSRACSSTLGREPSTASGGIGRRHRRRNQEVEQRAVAQPTRSSRGARVRGQGAAWSGPRRRPAAARRGRA